MSAFRKVVVSSLLLVLLSTCFVDRAHAIPAFARKYGLRCSACHEAWPMLNYFGQKFKDNGYQLMNDRDCSDLAEQRLLAGDHAHHPELAPREYQQGGHRPAGFSTGQQQITAHGFDVGGLDMLSGGTLDKNISFLFVLSSDENAAFHFESVNARLDNLFGSPWLNVKMGKFELDNIVSEKRGLTLTLMAVVSSSITSFRSETVTSSGRSAITSSDWSGWAIRRMTAPVSQPPS